MPAIRMQDETLGPFTGKFNVAELVVGVAVEEPECFTPQVRDDDLLDTGCQEDPIRPTEFLCHQGRTAVRGIESSYTARRIASGEDLRRSLYLDQIFVTFFDRANYTHSTTIQ